MVIILLYFALNIFIFETEITIFENLIFIYENLILHTKLIYSKLPFIIYIV